MDVRDGKSGHVMCQEPEFLIDLYHWNWYIQHSSQKINSSCLEAHLTGALFVSRPGRPSLFLNLDEGCGL